MSDQNTEDTRQMGAPPPGCDCFRLLRKNARGTFQMVSAKAKEEGRPAQTIFPVGDARSDVIGAVFGPGTYKLQWLKDEGGKLVPKGAGRVFTLDSAPAPKKKKKIASQLEAVPRRESELETFIRVRELVKGDYAGLLEAQRALSLAQLEAVRTGAEERIAQVTAFWQAQAAAAANASKAAPAASSNDAELLALKLKLAKLEGARQLPMAAPEREEEEEDDDGSGVLDKINQLAETIGPDNVQMVLGMLKGFVKKPDAGAAGGAAGGAV